MTPMGVVVINVDGALTVSNVSLVDCGGYVRQFSRSTAGRDTMQTIGTQSIRIDGTPMESLEFVKSSLPNSSPSEPIPNDTLCRLVADRLIQIWESWLMFTKMRDHIVAKPVAYIDVHRVGSKMRLFTDDF